ncbi:MAG: hypothetical protein ACXADY_13045 [Candidatus Hodarchaeales archaeon]|jgi:hypothetical protein
MSKDRNSKGRFKQSKNPRKHLLRLTDDEKKLIEEKRRGKKGE